MIYRFEIYVDNRLVETREKRLSQWQIIEYCKENGLEIEDLKPTKDVMEYRFVRVNP